MILCSNLGRRSTICKVLGTLFIAPYVTYSQDCGYDGGYSLRFPGPSCPYDSPLQCGDGGLQSRCCPAGLSCVGNDSYRGNYCCSGSTDCSPLAYDFPKCPRSTWSLWMTNETHDFDDKLETGAWCCKPGYKGVYWNNGSLASYQCTATTITSLQPSYYWAEPLSTASCSVTATATAAPSATENGPVSPSATNPTSAGADGQTSAGMSGGAIAGAVVGSVTGVVLMVAGVFFLSRKKRRSRRIETPLAVVPEEEHKRVDEHRHKSGRGSINEIATAEPRMEMEGNTPLYELDATEGGTFSEVPVSPMSPGQEKC